MPCTALQEGNTAFLHAFYLLLRRTLSGCSCVRDLREGDDGTGTHLAGHTYKAGNTVGNTGAKVEQVHTKAVHRALQPRQATVVLFNLSCDRQRRTGQHWEWLIRLAHKAWSR